MTDQPDYPHQGGDVTVLGPEIFVDQDGKVICWKGENYVRQAAPTEAAEPDTVTDPAWLCQQYAKAIAADDGHPWNTLPADRQEGYLDNADAVLRVRDRHLDQLRQRLELADAVRQQDLDSSAAAIQRADELAVILGAVLSAFPADLNPGGPAVPSRRLPAELVARWRAALDKPGPAATKATQATEWRTEDHAGHGSPCEQHPDGTCAQPEPGAVVDRQTAEVLAALHRSAEDTVTRVIDLYERWVKAGPPPLGASMARWWDMRLAELHTALDPSPEHADEHIYLSTGCFHGDHAYCQGMTGLNGAKRPGECKHCGAKCICGCHAAPETPGPA